MSLVPVKYPVDRTGIVPTNRVADEIHQLNNANYRVLVPRYGAFFTESISVREVASGRVLKKGVDYYPAMLHAMMSMDTGKEVHQLLVIVDPTVSANVYFTGQMVGGEYSYSWDAIVQMIQDLKLDQRKVLFENIIGLPEKYEPTPHMHDIGDVYGFEYEVAALERITRAIMIGSGAQLKSMYDYLDGQMAVYNAKLDAKLAVFGSADSIKEGLGYTPLDKAGDTAKGLMIFEKGMSTQGFFKEKIKRYNATSTLTTIDLNLATVYDITLASSTSFRFDVSAITGLNAEDAISFTFVVHNDAVAGHAIAFPANVQWADKVTPPRSAGANARDEYYFSSFDGGLTWTGSLSNANVGTAS